MPRDRPEGEKETPFLISYHFELYTHSLQADVLEPVRPAILLQEEVRSLVHLADLTALAFRRIGAVEEGDMLIADIAEPVSKEKG